MLDLQPDGHSTSPPARYTEPTLVRALEERGIGRPSTYASILGTIIDRGYVFKRGSALVPAWLAFAIIGLLEKHFGSLVDYDFTAAMEEDLDRIADGEQNRVDWLRSFYFGGGQDGDPGLHELVSGFGDIDAREVNSIPIGNDIILRVGRYGPYVQRGPDGDESSQRASVPEDMAPDELTVEKAEELLAAPSGDRELGTDPESGLPVVAKAGRYGPYVTEVLPDDARRRTPKPRTGSLLSTMSLDTVTLDDALRLLSLPRVVGVDPADGEEITAQNGRYGPYLKKGTDSRSLDNEEQMFDITLDAGAGDLRPAQAARPPRRRRAAQGARQRPDHRAAGRGQGGPVRPVRHRRRDQRDAAQGRRGRVRDDRAGRRAARREAGQGAGPEEAGRQEDRREEDGQEDGRQEGRRQEVLAPDAKVAGRRRTHVDRRVWRGRRAGRGYVRRMDTLGRVSTPDAPDADRS